MVWQLHSVKLADLQARYGLCNIDSSFTVSNPQALNWEFEKNLFGYE